MYIYTRTYAHCSCGNGLVVDAVMEKILAESAYYICVPAMCFTTGLPV